MVAPQSASAADRAEQLRQRCLERKRRQACFNRAEANLLVGRSIRLHNGFVHEPITRHGHITADVLAGLVFELDELELLVGRLSGAPLVPADERDDCRAACAGFCHGAGQTGHAEVDYPFLLRHGIKGIRAIIGEKIARLDTTDWRAQQQGDFYQSCLLALDGFAALADHAQDTVRRALEAEQDDGRRAELAALLSVIERVPMAPARTFYEAIQALTLTSLACEFGSRVSYIVPGRIDRSLWPYYRDDLAAGRITRDQALRLIECLYVIINENTADGGAVSVMVGGQDGRGNDTTNELSYLCLEALRRTRLVYPTVGVCWHENTPDDLLDLACDLIKNGITTPAVFGDETIARGLKHYGLDDTQAHHYINSTCVEITPVGCSNVYVASPYFNLCQTLIDEIDSGADHTDFDAFVAAYERRLAADIGRAVAVQNECRFSRAQFSGKPLQSILTRDCLDRGRDIDDGGARCNWIECSFVGLANLVDCLYVVRAEIFEAGRLTFAELATALHEDFTGREDLRQRFLRYPKYGNACGEVDDLVQRLTAFLRRECDRYRVFPDGRFIPGFFCWQMHERLGRETCATPDGRRAGFPFADGSGPAQGRERSGPTAAIISSTSWEHWPMIGGLVLNLKFPQALFRTAADVRKLRDLIKSYLKLGGFEIQINVADNETLRRAQEQPELYGDLVVRIAGYTDYFTRLSPEMQAEVIARSELKL